MIPTRGKSYVQPRSSARQMYPHPMHTLWICAHPIHTPEFHSCQILSLSIRKMYLVYISFMKSSRKTRIITSTRYPSMIHKQLAKWVATKSSISHRCCIFLFFLCTSLSFVLVSCVSCRAACVMISEPTGVQGGHVRHGPSARWVRNPMIDNVVPGGDLVVISDQGL